MKRAAFYLRVSTERQTTKNQVPALEQMARGRGFEVVEVYTETMSAAKERPVYDRMRADAHRGRFKVLLVWAIDRFGRSTLENIMDLWELHRRGVEVLSYTETWLDLSSPFAQPLISFVSYVAERERERLRERTVAGMDRARAEGKHIGRPRKHVPPVAVEELGATQREQARKLGMSDRTLRRHNKRTKGVPSKEVPKVAKSKRAK